MHIILVFSEQSTTFPHIPFVHCNFALDARNPVNFRRKKKWFKKIRPHFADSGIPNFLFRR
jgi:hypothetical protein